MASIHFKTGKFRKKTYYVVVSFGSKRKWIKAGTLQDAKLLKKNIEGMAESERLEKLGISPREKRIDDVFQEFLDFTKLRTAPSTVKRYRAALNTFLTFLKLFHPGLKYISRIRQEHLEEYQKKRLDSVELKQAAEADNQFSRKKKVLPKPQTVNYEVGVLRSVFLWAQERGFLSVVPTEKMKKLRSLPKKEARILSSEECRQFLKSARELGKTDGRMKVYALAFKFLLNTGLRSGELCNLTWDDVDFETGLIKIRPKEGWTPKSYSREFFLNDAALSVLGKLERDNSYIFSDEAGRQLDNDGLRNALIRVARAAGFEDFTRVHDLRHTFNSLLQMKGVDPATMGKILGHRDIETTMIYTHQTQEHLKRSIDKISIK